MRILIIEDDRDAAQYLAKGLRESGHSAEVAEDGRDGLLRAAVEPFDALIVDRMLPNLDGLSLVQHLRKTGHATPVLFLSALGEVDDRVKGLRAGGAQLKDGYALVRDGELWLHNVHIPPYGPAARENHEPERDRRLLAHRRQIDRLAGQIQEKGLTLVPTRMYFSDGRAKVEIALAKGKDRFDKREAIKERETKRDMERALREVHR